MGYCGAETKRAVVYEIVRRYVMYVPRRGGRAQPCAPVSVNT